MDVRTGRKVGYETVTIGLAGRSPTFQLEPQLGSRFRQEPGEEMPAFRLPYTES